MKKITVLQIFGFVVFLFGSLLVNNTSVFATAFPGAEGHGADATGGRGGQVIHVTNLDASGPGSLQAALSTSGPRIIVFDVSGVITADEIVFEHGDFTLAGETAPGGGITLNARLNSAYWEFGVTNFIIRHIRVRPTNLSGNQGDAIRIANNSNFILDHISTSWGSDETIDTYMSSDFTIQWSTIEESATYAGHPDGNFHNYAFINGPDGENVSLHHNLFAHHSQRTPAIANGMSDIINNVSYNFRRGFNHHNEANTAGFNFIGNYYKAGPDENDPIVILIDDEDRRSGPYYYMEDLYFNGVASDPWDLVSYWPNDPEHVENCENDTPPYNNTICPPPSQAASRFITPNTITTHSSTDAYDLVLAQAGAWPRDTVTLRTINEVENGTGSWGRSVPNDLMEGLSAGTAPTDSDNDGMPDDWENDNGLDPNDADHNGNDISNDYTNIEVYLHYRSDLLINSGVSTCNDNGICEIGESNASCPNDCPSICTENWTCTGWSDWSECTGNSQSRTRTCTDQNSCGTDNSRPSETETRSCTPSDVSADDYQAEEAQISNGAVETDHAGYNGTGYVNYNNQVGSYVRWTIHVDDAGDYQVEFRYANGAAENRPLQIDVNGNPSVNSLDFPATDDWDSWGTQTTTVQLNAGDNTIAATAVNDSGGPNMDQIALSLLQQDDPDESDDSGDSGSGSGGGGSGGDGDSGSSGCFISNM